MQRITLFFTVIKMIQTNSKLLPLFDREKNRDCANKSVGNINEARDG
jgi:hypothetical protein